MNKIIVAAVAVILLVGGVYLGVHKSTPQKFGVVATLPSSATQNAERAAVNDLITLATNFSSTTANTFTSAQTFSAGWIISATSTGTNGIAITGGCFSFNGTCLAPGGSGTVTSITGGTGLNGGAITTAGTLSLKSYLGTSTADTANQISVFTSTNATPATFGGFANFTFNSATNNFVVINASTTNLTASQSLFVNSIPVSGYIYASYVVSTSTTATGTTTNFMEQTFVSTTYYGVECKVRPSGATWSIQIGDGTASTTMVVASSTNNIFTFPSSVTFASKDSISLDVGTPASSPTQVLCTTKRTQAFQ